MFWECQAGAPDEWVRALDEHRNICSVFSESRHPDKVSAQAIIETAAKAPFIDFAAEIARGRGDESRFYFGGAKFIQVFSSFCY